MLTHVIEWKTSSAKHVTVVGINTGVLSGTDNRISEDLAITGDVRRHRVNEIRQLTCSFTRVEGRRNGRH